MDSRIYYQKIREQRASITAAFPIVVSIATPDGGKAGTMTEVTPELAAKMVVDGTGRLAKNEEAAQFRQALAAAKKTADDELAASRVQMTVIPKQVLDQLQRKA